MGGDDSSLQLAFEAARHCFLTTVDMTNSEAVLSARKWESPAALALSVQGVDGQLYVYSNESDIPTDKQLAMRAGDCYERLMANYSSRRYRGVLDGQPIPVATELITNALTLRGLEQTYQAAHPLHRRIDAFAGRLGVSAGAAQDALWRNSSPTDALLKLGMARCSHQEEGWRVVSLLGWPLNDVTSGYAYSPDGRVVVAVRAMTGPSVGWDFLGLMDAAFRVASAMGTTVVKRSYDTSDVGRFVQIVDTDLV